MLFSRDETRRSSKKSSTETLVENCEKLSNLENYGLSEGVTSFHQNSVVLAKIFRASAPIGTVAVEWFSC